MFVVVGVHTHKKLEISNPVSRHSPPSQASARPEHELAPAQKMIQPEVMRIKEMITQGELFSYFNNFSTVLL